MQERAQALAARGDVVGATRLMDEFLSAHDGDWGSWLYLAGLHARLGRTGPAVAAYQACARQLEGEERYERARAALQHALRLTPEDESLAQEISRLEGLAHGLREVPPPPPAPSVPPKRAGRPPPASSKDVTTAVVARRSSSAEVARASVEVARSSAELARSPLDGAQTPAASPPPADSTAVVARRALAPTAGPAPRGSAPRPTRAPVKVLRRSGLKAVPPPEDQATTSLPAAPSRSAEETFLMIPAVLDSGTDPYLAIFDILDAEKRDDRLCAARPRDRMWNQTTPTLRRRAMR